MIRVGIECESIEDSQTWGIGKQVSKLLEYISLQPELKNEFKFFLYFKSKIPDYKFLGSPIFEKRVVKPRFFPVSFSLYYYIFMPIRVLFDRLDVTYLPNYMLPVLFFGKSLVTLTDDVYSEMRNKALPLRYRLAYYIFSNWAAKHATKIMALSHASAEEIVKLFHISANRIAVNYNGIDIKQFRNNINEKENFILYVGQAFPRRHLKETILAFDSIAERFPDLKLVAVGVDKYNPPIISKLVSEINNKYQREVIVYFDYVSEQKLIDLYSKAKLFIYISSQEAFGFPPLEALACKTPPVIADKMINREIYDENAFFVKNPESVEEIAYIISDALENDEKRKKIQDNSESIVNNFTWQNHVDRFLNIIRSISNEK